MAKQGKFIHQGIWVGTKALTNAYAASLASGIEVKPNQSQFYNEVLTGKLSYFVVKGDTLGGGPPTPTSITAFITEDAAGDEIIIPETTMTLTFGRSAAGTWVGSARLDVDVRLKSPTTDLYVWIKTDSGTATAKQVQLNWEE